MKLSSRFAVPAPPARVFPLFLDVDVMRSCIPGCEELTRIDENTFRGRLVSVVAHVRFNAGFSVSMTSVEPPTKVVAVLKGEDHRLGSSIKMEAVLVVEPDGAGSLVGYEMELALWGKLGRLGESIVRKRTAEVETQFVTKFSEACAIEPAAAPDRAVAARSIRPEALAAETTSAPADGWWARFVSWFWQRKRANHRHTGSA